ncbi:putative creatininase [Treponema primitia ZAS-2]|uniref:Putative creatininase n=1 Tax=Treponema primitia (strain ATCC BAA-887 / DSM 12427 / ZAS-2) TaxID=545694 RepID=F5YJX2_TREPZ|nr:creatininase family protein [Treponema primitia]AEF83628.1 putative creatininase [Treponema primitia ZAS-2]
MKGELLYEVRGPKTILEMTAAEFGEAVKRAPIAVLAFGSVENHSTHLPLSADTLQGTELIKRAAEKLTEKGLPALPAFCVPYGVETNRFERQNTLGNVSLSQKTFIQMVTELSLSLVKNGFKRLVFCVSHTENLAAMHVAAKDLGDEHDVPVIVVNWIPPMNDEWPKFLKNAAHQGHGGEDETACVMAVTPHLVDISNSGSYHPPEDTNPVKSAGLHYYGGALGIYTPIGADKTPGFVGDPSDADAKAGEICYDLYADWIADAVCKYWKK